MLLDNLLFFLPQNYYIYDSLIETIDFFEDFRIHLIHYETFIQSIFFIIFVSLKGILFVFENLHYNLYKLVFFFPV